MLYIVGVGCVVRLRTERGGGGGGEGEEEGGGLINLK